VRKVEPEGTAWAVRSGSGTVRADRVLVATGKSDLAGRRRSGGLHDGLVGLKRYAVLRPEAAAALAGSVELVLFPGGYCGIQPVEDGSANVCLVIEARALKSCGTDGAFHAVRRGSTRGAELLEGALWTSERPAAVGWLPYGFVQTRTDGLFRLGDQAAVIPSFCGEGMGLALSSARLAAEAVLADETAAAYQRRFARVAGARVRGAALLSRALCAGPLQPVAAATARAAPALMRGIAALTRTPPAAGSHPPHEPVLPGQGVR
jgi:flavin-dependent dehydrogenase